MQYGLWESVTAFTVSVMFIVLAWRLPNIILALKEWKK